MRTGKFCIGLSGPDTNLAELMSGNNGNNKKERAQTKWTFIFESDQVPEKFKAGDVIVSQQLRTRSAFSACDASGHVTRVVAVLLQSVSYDQSDYPTILNFHHNGHDAPFKSITSVRGDMRPAVSGEQPRNPPDLRGYQFLPQCVVLNAKLCACLTLYAAVSGQAVLEMVFDEDLFSQTPPNSFYPLMHGTSLPRSMPRAVTRWARAAWSDLMVRVCLGAAREMMSG